MSDKEFPDGIIVRYPRDRAPDFIRFTISINRKDLGNWLRKKDDEWINLDVCKSKSGKLYASVNDYQPERRGSRDEDRRDKDFDDDIPF